MLVSGFVFLPFSRLKTCQAHVKQRFVSSCRGCLPGFNSEFRSQILRTAFIPPGSCFEENLSPKSRRNIKTPAHKATYCIVFNILIDRNFMNTMTWSNFVGNPLDLITRLQPVLPGNVIPFPYNSTKLMSVEVSLHPADTTKN